jgi:glycosyltransferase involved in cell wall biosynthesis
VQEKGFDLLLTALASIRDRFPHADLAIAGKGPEEPSLRMLARELGLERAVLFAGYVERPAALFSGATLFVLPSRHEGVPNALLEAAATGLPLVSTPASGGVVDMLCHQPGTWIAEGISAAALTAAIQTALGAIRPGQRFAHAFLEPFSFSRAIRAYEDLIDGTLSSSAVAGLQH